MMDSPLADPWAPTPGSKFRNIHAVFGPNNRLAPPFWELIPPIWEILDPPFSHAKWCALTGIICCACIGLGTSIIQMSLQVLFTPGMLLSTVAGSHNIT